VARQDTPRPIMPQVMKKKPKVSVIAQPSFDEVDAASIEEYETPSMEVEVEENNNKEKIGEIYRQKMFTSFVQ
jgi:hypothetical protein